ncbi:MAG: hypothetical protein SGPRY_000456 [Prymnesium sp.]
MEIIRLLLAIASLSAAEAFAPLPRLTSHSPRSPLASPLPLASHHLHSPMLPSRRVTPKMGLFGLGWGEIGVLAVVGLLVFGPEKLAPLAKDIGKSASGLKEVADSFSEGLQEGNVEADSLKTAAPQVLDTTAKEDTKTKQELKQDSS